MSDNINPEHYKRLPVEAIEIIESAIDNALSAQDAYLHGQVLKYVLRCWHKNGIEDLRKAKWYLDRLIEHCDELLLDAHKPAELPKEQPQLPDGYRWLSAGEVIRKGDKGFENGLFHAIEPMKTGMTLQAHWMPTIRRNRFAVGEKVVAKNSHEIWEVDSLVNGIYQLRKDQTFFGSYPEHLAPYIEETT